MGVMNRIVKMFKADIHAVMDRLQDDGLLLKQYLREMQAALDQKEMHLKQMQALLREAIVEHEKYQRESEKLEQNLRVAIQKNRDDIARLLIKKRKSVITHRDAHQRHISHLDQDIIALKDSIQRQRLQYDSLKHRSAAYFQHLEQKELRPASVVSGCWEDPWSLSEEEVELELLQRKEVLLQEGALSC